MGWSANRAACETLDAISEEFQYVNGSSNAMPDGGFWERSNVEHADGSITGTVWTPYQYDKTKVVKKGSFKIAGYGGIIRFPGLTKKHREQIYKRANYSE